MNYRLIAVIAGREFSDACRNRWVIMLAVMFGLLALGLSLLGVSGLGTLGISGFGRTAASLLNMVLLLVPLMGLLIGAVSIASEREQGSLLLLMAQPITAQEILIGKFAGACLALAVALGWGFGISALVIAKATGFEQLAAYLGLMGLALLLGMCHVALGLWVSAMARRVGAALGAALIIWLCVICLGDLGVMGTSIMLRLSPGELLWASLGNPGQVFRLAALQTLHGNLEQLGSSGSYASNLLGPWLIPALIGLLFAWIALPLAIALVLFRRRGAL